MSAAALASAVNRLGVPCDIETIGGVAVVVVRDAPGAHAIAEPACRQEIAALARAHGFSHVAVELTDDVTHATVPRA
ncbi:MAG: hypothetical protein NVS4B3_00600 [Gemmatimonadaceae bacterium]